jgi:cob(I)alamin adenosyltransferase
VQKSSKRIEAYGTIDELNAFIACLLEEIDNREDRAFLLCIQSNLFALGSYLASETGVCTIPETEIDKIETEIDRFDTVVPPLHYFILPGGCKSNALAHVCRTICRRAERCISKLHKSNKINENVLKYINRLSDYFFLLARKQSFIHNIEEIIWENTCK